MSHINTAFSKINFIANIPLVKLKNIFRRMWIIEAILSITTVTTDFFPFRWSYQRKQDRWHTFSFSESVILCQINVISPICYVGLTLSQNVFFVSPRLVLPSMLTLSTDWNVLLYFSFSHDASNKILFKLEYTNTFKFKFHIKMCSSISVLDRDMMIDGTWRFACLWI